MIISPDDSNHAGRLQVRYGAATQPPVGRNKNTTGETMEKMCNI